MGKLILIYLTFLPYMGKLILIYLTFLPYMGKLILLSTVTYLNFT